MDRVSKTIAPFRLSLLGHEELLCRQRDDQFLLREVDGTDTLVLRRSLILDLRKVWVCRRTLLPLFLLHDQSQDVHRQSLLPRALVPRQSVLRLPRALQNGRQLRSVPDREVSKKCVTTIRGDATRLKRIKVRPLAWSNVARHGH